VPDPSLAIIAPNFAPRIGGIESFVAGLAGSAWPLSTTVVAPPAPGSGAWDRSVPYRVERRRLLSPVPPRWAAARPLVDRLQRQADVLLFAEWWPAARALASFPRPGTGPRARRVLMVYGTEIVGARGRAGAAMRRSVRAMDLVVAISAYTAARLTERVDGCPPVEILHPGVDPDPPRADPSRIREALGLGPGPIVLTAARLVPRKGHSGFAGHWAGVEAQVPGAQWVVAGDGPCAEELRRVAPPSVHLVGAVDQPTLMGLYAMADVHLLPGIPSDEVEGFGMAIVEAGAAGTPSVASDLGGTAEALGDGGVLVPGGDLAGMAAAVAGLLQDEGRRAELGRRALRRAEGLRWELVGARFRELVAGPMEGAVR
jgi:phosphatidylinositol alpha-1,6-mannosyltransferase